MTIKQVLTTNILKLTRFPIMPKTPKIGKWYRIPLKQCVASNGMEYHTGVRIGTENKLIIMFYGGGVSWNEYMAARPNSLYGNPAEINFYASDAELIVDLAAKIGVPEISKNEDNPLRNWSVITIPYSSGDFHCGTGDFSYTALDGIQKVLHHHGYKNYRAAIEEAMKYIGTEPDQILVSGFSAGGFGTALLTDDVIRTFPNCKDVTCYVDSGFMRNPKWHTIAEQVWKAPKEITERLTTDNLTLDCLKALKKDHEEKVKIAFSCSVRDAALSEYINYIDKDQLYADKESGAKFQQQLTEMCEEMQKSIPNISLFLFDTPEDGEEKQKANLTKHCVMASEKIVTDGVSARDWLWDAVRGKSSCVGMDLLYESLDEKEN